MKRLLILFIISCTICSAQALTPVEKFGQLRVSGNQIVDQNGEAVQLRGMSLFWSQWIGKYYNASAIEWLVKDWKINVIRVAMAVDNNGYATNKKERQKVINVIDAAIREGIYVIVDFHVHDGNKYLTEATTFFSEIARQYGKYPNIIYEPWNEPVNHSWSKVIKPYHEAVIRAIRQYDPDNLIVCGTRKWSQEVEEASLDPIVGVNIAYTLHFYASTHKQSLRNTAQRAMANGVALMVTEYGTCEASGDGYINEEETRAWWKFLDENKISHCNWSLSDKKESASALTPGASENGAWSETQITPSGKLVREEIRTKN